MSVYAYDLAWKKSTQKVEYSENLTFRLDGVSLASFCRAQLAVLIQSI